MTNKETNKKLSKKAAAFWRVRLIENLSAIITIMVCVAVFVAFLFNKDEIKLYAKEAVYKFGLPALFLFCWAADVIIQPIPSDVVVFGSTLGGASVWATAIVAGFASSIGGTTGYYLSKFFGPRSFARFFGMKRLRKGRDLFKRHGALAVFVSGITPIPYSAVCWIGGIYRMPVYKVLAASLVSRTLRYLLMAWLGYQVA